VTTPKRKAFFSINYLSFKSGTRNILMIGH
jgi:hypothetical protein